MAPHTLYKSAKGRERSAMNDFFRTVELLENAFSRLLAIDLIAIQRTSRIFRATIYGSIKLNMIITPPIFAETWRLYYLPKGVGIFVRDDDGKLKSAIERLHGGVIKEGRKFQPRSLNSALFSLSDCGLYLVPRRPMAKYNPQSSCVNMFITNSPTKRVHVNYIRHKGERVFGDLRVRTGIMMGDLIGWCNKKGVPTIESISLTIGDLAC